jgi:Lar family restriction alleviation protein
MKDCPFCGSDDVHLVDSRRPVFDTFYYLCENCLAEGPPGENKEQALERWEERNVL